MKTYTIKNESRMGEELFVAYSPNGTVLAINTAPDLVREDIRCGRQIHTWDIPNLTDYVEVK